MDPTDLAALLPLLILSGWAVVLLLVDAFLPPHRRGLTALLAAAGLLAAGVPVVGSLGRPTTAFGGTLIFDGFGAFLALLFLSSSLFGLALAFDHLRRMHIARGEFYSLLLFSTAGMLLMGYAADLITVFLALELLSIPLYILAGLASPRPSSEESALKYFLLSTFASGFVVYGIALIYGATGSTHLAEVVAAIRAGVGWPALLYAGAALMLVGFGFKVGVVPFHMWTPDVYQGAPSPVVAVMSVGAKAGGFAALLRVFVAGFPDLVPVWAPAAAWVAALTMVWGNVAAIAQSNIKRLLAYSSIAHAGYVLVALASASEGRLPPQAVTAALVYLVAYGVTALGAWAVVLAVEREQEGGLAIDDYAGLGARRPWLALAMAIFMLSFTGVPPTIGFIGKFILFRAAVDAGQIALALVGVLTSLVSAYYYLRVVVVMYMREGAPQVHMDRWLRGAIALAALATVLLGVLPGPLLGLAEGAGMLALLPAP